ncbi:hypothetical protein M422DRAFT_33379 [Sphaerobolus stellatus SS14]|uniref:Uncharacterized protein n=1 Tax=Sphaerobolus stellatus (strain SS14) TaxID=990650 RepID=A0A0C9U1I5_SPHS4|nr:hypothetical protein M422DRAFT_37536 [Sphaerobolus stellatus SS14]KIJ38250.1 hypothetical protein M422DRAFT_33379 [Sphaerobolus stellatus SS14]
MVCRYSRESRLLIFKDSDGQTTRTNLPILTTLLNSETSGRDINTGPTSQATLELNGTEYHIQEEDTQWTLIYPLNDENQFSAHNIPCDHKIMTNP